VSLLHEPAGGVNGTPAGGRALKVLDAIDGERSSESGMQHLSLLHTYLPVRF
jgi:hypothetical protein